MGEIPEGIEGVTVPWLREATGLAVEAFETEQIAVGIGVSSALYRLALQGAGCPPTLIVKLPALDEAAVFTSTVLRMYLREVGFFERLADAAPIRVSGCLHAAVDAATSRFALVLEDLGGLRNVDQLVGMSAVDAGAAIDGLARWHATWWGQGDALAAAELTVGLGDPIYKAVLPTVFAEGWEKLEAEVPIPASVREVAPDWTEAMPRLLDGLAEAPATMTHGDFRGDNLFFDADGAVAAVDFQLVGSGRGIYDVAYFVTQSLDRSVASLHERVLVERWRAALVAGGVDAGDLDTAWEDYRSAALFCLVYPVVAWRGMNVDEPRHHRLVTTMLDRFDRAVTDLELAALL